MLLEAELKERVKSVRIACSASAFSTTREFAEQLLGNLLLTYAKDSMKSSGSGQNVSYWEW
jgi:hypothetical protein